MHVGDSKVTQLRFFTGQKPRLLRLQTVGPRWRRNRRVGSVRPPGGGHGTHGRLGSPELRQQGAGPRRKRAERRGESEMGGWREMGRGMRETI